MKKVIGGGFLVFVGLFMLLGLFASTKPANLLVDGMVFLLFVLGPVIGGGLLIRSHYALNTRAEVESRKASIAAREKEVLRLAKARGGELTIPDIVTETSMSTEEADEVMRELVVKRFADMKMTDSGAIVYEFFELLRDEPEDRRPRLESWKDEKDVN